VLLLPIVVITGVHSLVFGHSRYHLPLVPVLGVYAAAVLQAGPIRLAGRHRVAAFGALLTLGLIVALWARQIFLVDAGRLRALFEKVL
jgi:hypothetical protein